MHLSANLNDGLLPKLRARYERRSRAGKPRMLDEWCEDHGHERKYALKLLRGTVPAPCGSSRDGRLHDRPSQNRTGGSRWRVAVAASSLHRR